MSSGRRPGGPSGAPSAGGRPRAGGPSSILAGREPAPHLRVNPIMCEAHGLCAELLPELIRLDDWGYPIIEQSEVPPELEGLARRAVDACPTLALLLERKRG
jgi:ferredoxin